MAISNLDLLAFASLHPIDKIVQQGEVSITNSGPVVSYQQAKIVTSTVENNYGRAALARGRWSIDGGTTWQALDSTLVYTFTVNSEAGDPGHPSSATLNGLDAAISIGCSDSTVYFRTANGKHGTVTGLVTPEWTPTSYTFIIQYWLYERE